MVFSATAATTIAVPVVAYIAAPQRAEGALNSARSWLVANNATVMAILLVTLGAVVIGNGIGSF